MQHNLAIVSVIVTGFLGAFGIASTWLGLRTSQSHARQLAEADRAFEARRGTYEDILTAVHLRARQIGEVHTPKGHEELPPAPSVAEMAALDAVIGVFGSADLRKAVSRFGDLVSDFRGRAWSYESIIKQSHGQPIPLEEKARVAMEAARKAVMQQVLEVERIARADLGIPGS